MKTLIFQDPSIKASVLTALSDVLSKLAQKCSEAAQSKIINATGPLLYQRGVSETLKVASSECLGSLLSRHVSAEALLSYLKDHVEPQLTSQDTDSRMVKSCC